MPLYTPDGGAVAPEWADLAKKVTDGDGLGWRGDPDLWLGIGVVVNPRTGKTGRRLEVWRDNTDGSTTMIAHWLPTEQHMVCYDLAKMRVDAPGHVSVVDRIDQHNDALEKAASDAAVESMMETLDHAIRVDHDRNNPRNQFFMNGDRAGRA